MKKYLIPILLFTFIFTNSIKAQYKTETASSILNNAFKQAKKEHKKVFVMFHASWCGWCKKMETSMNDVSTKKLFNNNYVIKHLVVQEAKTKKHLENHGADLILKKFGGDKSGIPYWLIFDENSNLLADSKMVNHKLVLKEEGENIGCPGTPQEVDAFIYKLKQTSNLTNDELKIIAKRFRQNSPN